MLAPLLLLVASSFAAVPVLVSRFEVPKGQEAVATQLPKWVGWELGRHGEVEVLTPTPAVLVKGRPAPDYLTRCPIGETIPCTFEVGRAFEARYAVTGVVRTVTAASTGGKASSRTPLKADVDVTILDLETISEVTTRSMPYTQGMERAFGDSVALLVLDVISGKVKAEGPATEETPSTDPLDDERDLSGLSGELGIGTPPAAEEPVEEPGRHAEAPLRRGTLVVRLQGGYGWGLRDERYYGRTFVDEPASVDITSHLYWQSVQSGPGPSAGFGVGFGLSDHMQGEVSFSMEGGTYYEQLVHEVDSTNDATEVMLDDFNLGWQATLGSRWLIPLGGRIEPCVGVGVAWRRGTAVQAHQTLPFGTMPAFAAPNRLGPYALLGLEVFLADHLDLVLQAPVSWLGWGTAAEPLERELDELSLVAYPAAPWGLDAVVQLGIQGRFGGE